jgi:Ran GTPase-activating protein (RanGAP) involved in mRNA processing and transport
MTLKEKIKVYRFKKYWKKQGKQDLSTWVHRYLRLHSELIEDDTYKQIYDYHRNQLIKFIQHDIVNKFFSNADLGNLIDSIADTFNQSEYDRVNEYKALVDELYILWEDLKYDK